MSEILQFNLDKEVATIVNAEKNTSDGPKIQKVPAFLRERAGFRQYYSPKLISIGPIHHRHHNVKAGEQYKHMWAATWIQTKYFPRVDNEQWQQGNSELIKDKYAEFKDKIVKEVIEQCYSEDVIEEKHKENNYEPLAWMLFVDGCSVLEFMKEADISNPGVLKIKIDQMILMQQDMLLLENQIPFQLLKLLCPEQDEPLNSMHKFLKLHHIVSNRAKISKPVSISPQPTHLLDYLRNKILDDGQIRIDVMEEIDVMENEYNPLKWVASKKINWPRHRNIRELKAAGIKAAILKEGSIRSIHFSSHRFFGRLYLPEVIVDDSTATTYMNLMAYEICPDFRNDFAISSYVAFLGSLIDHADDAKGLESAGILHNYIGSDEEVANLFNTISTDLVPNPRAYDKVREMMEEHFRYKCTVWMAEYIYVYVPSRWSAFAVFILFLTCVQTYYTAFPK